MKKKLLVAALFTLAGTGAMAQSASFKPGFYAGIELGYASLKDQTQETANDLVGAVGGRVSVTQDSGIFDGRLFGGYKIIENIDFELYNKEKICFFAQEINIFFTHSVSRFHNPHHI
jgi:hypothetical protein